jgi:hypothetical protein
MLIIVKLISMNAASRKNMMSISGMISIRARLIGTGELLCILVGDNIVSASERVQHQNDVVRSRFEFELEPGHSRIEEIEENQGENRDPQTTCGSN